MPGHVLIVAAALLWATLGPVARLLLHEGVGALEIGFWRAVFAAVLFAVHATVRRQPWVSMNDLPVIGGFALVGVALFYVAFFRAVESGGAALAAILLYTAPVWVAIAARLWLRERITTRKAVAIGLTLAGVTLVAGGSGDGARAGASATAITWGLVSGIAYSSYYLFGKRYFVRYQPARIFAIAMPIGALAMLPMITFAAKPAWAWALLLFIAAVPTYGAYLLYAAGLARIEATRAATIATLEPMVAAVLAFLVWGETLRTVAIAGAALILAGVVISARAPTPTPPPASAGSRVAASSARSVGRRES